MSAPPTWQMGSVADAKHAQGYFIFSTIIFFCGASHSEGWMGQSGSAALRRRRQSGHSGDDTKAEGRSTTNVNAFSLCQFPLAPRNLCSSSMRVLLIPSCKTQNVSDAHYSTKRIPLFCPRPTPSDPSSDSLPPRCGSPEAGSALGGGKLLLTFPRASPRKFCLVCPSYIFIPEWAPKSSFSAAAVSRGVHMWYVSNEQTWRTHRASSLVLAFPFVLTKQHTQVSFFYLFIGPCNVSFFLP